jgi:hypothetical protein
MSKLDENEIQNRLDRISRIEPRPEDTQAAIDRARKALASQQESKSGERMQGPRRVFFGRVGRFAAAAVLMIAVGFLAGRVSSSRATDLEQLELALESRLTSSVETAIRKDLLDEVNRNWQSALASHRAKLAGELNRFAAELDEQRYIELNECAAKTLAASNAVTHRLLNDLVEAIVAAQAQDRRLVAEAMRRIESNRIEDSTRLSVGLVALADETAETKRSVAQLSKTILPGLTNSDIQEN